MNSSIVGLDRKILDKKIQAEKDKAEEQGKINQQKT
jgi:hypothetical protein